MIASKQPPAYVPVCSVRRLSACNTRAKIIKLDLELGSGAVEGAVKNIIGKRRDHGGMRWIEERVEAVVQLRCIEANGDWDRFIDFVHDRMQAEAQRDGTRLRLQSSTPAELPALLEAA